MSATSPARSMPGKGRLTARFARPTPHPLRGFALASKRNVRHRKGVPATMDATALTQSPQVDWPELRALYVKGVSLIDLARKTGVSYDAIRSRASREKWRNTVTKVNEQVLNATTLTLTERATFWVHRLDKFIHNALGALDSKDVSKLSLRDLQTALDCADKANRVARSNYGLDSAGTNATGQPRVAVQVNIAGHHAQGLVVPITSEQVLDAELVGLLPEPNAPKQS